VFVDDMAQVLPAALGEKRVEAAPVQPAATEDAQDDNKETEPAPVEAAKIIAPLAA
jgi:hypothetical protein